MAEKTVGYIVTLGGYPMWAESRKRSVGDLGVLYYSGGEVTTFRTRRAANRAIQRTLRYQQDGGLDWGTEYLVHRLVVTKGDSE